MLGFGHHGRKNRKGAFSKQSYRVGGMGGGASNVDFERGPQHFFFRRGFFVGSK